MGIADCHHVHCSYIRATRRNLLADCAQNWPINDLAVVLLNDFLDYGRISAAAARVVHREQQAKKLIDRLMSTPEMEQS